MAIKNVVLVHGAFADGSSWSKVINIRATASTLPSSHAVMLSHGKEVANLIADAAQAAAAR